MKNWTFPVSLRCLYKPGWFVFDKCCCTVDFFVKGCDVMHVLIQAPLCSANRGNRSLHIRIEMECIASSTTQKIHIAPLTSYLCLLSCKSLFLNIKLPQTLAVVFVIGGLLHCNISIFNAGGAACSWSYITRGQRRNQVLPLPRPIPPHWSRGTSITKCFECLNIQNIQDSR